MRRQDASCCCNLVRIRRGIKYICFFELFRFLFTIVVILNFLLVFDLENPAPLILGMIEMVFTIIIAVFAMKVLSNDEDTQAVHRFYWSIVVSFLPLILASLLSVAAVCSFEDDQCLEAVFISAINGLFFLVLQIYFITIIKRYYNLLLSGAFSESVDETGSDSEDCSFYLAQGEEVELVRPGIGHIYGCYMKKMEEERRRSVADMWPTVYSTPIHLNFSFFTPVNEKDSLTPDMFCSEKHKKIEFSSPRVSIDKESDRTEVNGTSHFATPMRKRTHSELIPSATQHAKFIIGRCTQGTVGTRVERTKLRGGEEFYPSDQGDDCDFSPKAMVEGEEGAASVPFNTCKKYSSVEASSSSCMEEVPEEDDERSPCTVNAKEVRVEIQKEGSTESDSF
mmetsp:Transcript_30808/g.35072  ORF Transcript_30808/g.35072 Transcript_30808/m.35072 type:complete len:395 (+) Transcript_30808:253-1437(+)